MIPEDAIWILELIRNRDARTEAEKDAVNAAIEALKAQLSQERTEKRMETHGVCLDAISRQAAIDALQEEIDKGIPPFDDVIASIRCGVRLARNIIEDLPPAQPELTDIDAKEAVYNLAEKIGIHQLFALTVELRGEPVQPELTYEQVEEYCKRRCLHVVTADFFESTKPQRLGHWIKHIDPFDGEQYECSECGVLWEFNDGTPEDNEAYYCPKCGAKMKGEANE